MQRKTGFTALVYIVCEEWCLGGTSDERGNPSDFRRFIPKTGAVTAEQFVDWVFRASGPGAQTSDPIWQRARSDIYAAFIRLLGAKEVDASLLQWTEPNLPLTNPELFARKRTNEELQLDLATDGDWRDAIIAQRELGRRARPVRFAVWGGLIAILLTLASLVSH